MAALDLLCDVATAAPVLAVIDDAHWLDRQTTEVLAFVAHRVEADPILLLTATRDGYDAELPPSGPEVYQVGPLAHDAAGALLDTAPRTLGGGIRDRVLQQAAGNPLALIELPLTAGSEPGATQPGVVSLTERLEAGIRRPALRPPRWHAAAPPRRRP